MNSAHIENILGLFPQRKVLVIGDIMLDEYIWGKVERISPEAPVPVVEVKSRTSVPGGAANVANNLSSLGCKPAMAGVLGDDIGGKMVLEHLKNRGIMVEGTIIDQQRPTTVKTRIIAQNQQIARTDMEKREPISTVVVDSIMGYVRRSIDGIHGVIISDYGKGVITMKLLEELVPFLRKHKVKVAVDPKVANISLYKGITIMTPNTKEAGEAVGMKIVDNNSLLRVGRELLRVCDAQGILITRGEEGMSLFKKKDKADGGEISANGVAGRVKIADFEDIRVTHIPTVARKVYDVTGAGDTVIAALTLALASGASMETAAIIANHAAGVVVGQVGTSVATTAQICSAIKDFERAFQKNDCEAEGD